jgi:aryl-alcohol dehydrogenase-like predicted oxidoreductase
MTDSGTARRRRLGATGIEVSPIGLGGLQFAGRGMAGRVYTNVGQDTADAIVAAALAGGVDWFDTAEMYGRGESERMLATALKHNGVPVGDARIATKWSPTGRTAASIERTIGTRLACLDGYPIDLHQIHAPRGALSPLSAQVAAMGRLLESGKVRSVGVSNFSARQMARADAVLRAKGARLASNQVHANLLHRDVERNGVLETARRLGVTLIAYAPLGGGLLTGRYHDDPGEARARSFARRMMGRVYGSGAVARTMPLIAAMRAIGRAHGVSVSQVALAWLLAHYGDTLVAIPGASRPGQAAESAAAMDLRLTSSEMGRLDDLTRV